MWIATGDGDDDNDNDDDGDITEKNFDSQLLVSLDLT